MPISWSRLFRFSPSRAFAVDCGASRVAAAEFRIDRRGRVHLRHFEQAALESSGSEVEPWPQRIGQTLSQLGARKRWRGTSPLVLSGQHTLLKFIRSSASDGMGAKGVMEFEAQQAIPCPLDEVTWDHASLTEISGELDVVIAAAKRSITEALSEAASTAGVLVDRILSAPLALLRAYHFNYPDIHERSLVVDVGARSTNLVFIDHPRYFARSFALGGFELTRLLAAELGVSPAQAEEWKQTHLSELTPAETTPEDVNSRFALDRAVKTFRDRLEFEIDRTILAYTERFSRHRPELLLITGGGAQLRGWPEMLADRFSVRVVRYDPLRRLEVSKELAAQEDLALLLPPPLLGAALLRLQPGGRWPNLLPEPRKTQLRARVQGRVVLACLVLALAALVPLVGYWEARVRRAEFNQRRWEDRLVAMRVLAAQNRQNLGMIEKARAELTVLQRTVEKREGWIRFLSDLQERLAQTEDVWLEQLQLDVSAAGSESHALERTVALGGRLLDTDHPRSKVSPDSYQRVLNLLKLLGQSPFVANVKEERFDNSQPGILRFNCTLVLPAGNSL